MKETDYGVLIYTLHVLCSGDTNSQYATHARQKKGRTKGTNHVDTQLTITVRKFAENAHRQPYTKCENSYYYQL